MFLLVNNKILNVKRVTTIEIDRDTPSEINYLFCDGGYIKERFNSEELALAKFNDNAKNKSFISTSDKRLINHSFIKDILQDSINTKRIVYVIYNGAPLKELLESEDAVIAKVESLKGTLSTIEDSGISEPTDLSNYYTKTESDGKFATELDLTIDPSTFIMTAKLNDTTGKALSTQTIDLPLETMVVSAEYDKKTKEIVLKLENGTSTRVSVADLVSGLASTSDIPTKVSQLTNDSKYATTDELTKQIGTVTTNVSNVEKKIPTKTSQLTNDSSFVTTETLTQEIGTVNTSITNMGKTIPTKTSQLTNDSDLTTKAYVDAEIEKVKALISPAE